MPITRTPIVDDSGGGTDGTVLNNAWKQELYDQIDGADVAASTTTVINVTDTGTVHNWAPGVAGGHTYIGWSGAAPLTVTGFASSGLLGQKITFRNTGASVAHFAHVSASSGAGNKIFNMVASAATPIAPGGSATWIWNSAVWVMLNHEQGAWITPAFVASDFSGSGAMLWTLAAGDVTVCKYRLQGKTLQVAFKLDTCTIAGTPSTVLQIGAGAYGGFAWTSPIVDATGYVLDAGAVVDAYFQAGGFLGVYKRNSSAWTAGANNNYVYGSYAGEVN